MKVSSDILRVYKSLHTWTGIVAGLVLFIGFFAGALTMFKQPLDRWASRPVVAASHDMPPVVPGDTLLPQLLSAHPQAEKDLTVYIRRQENHPASASWKEGRDGHGLDLHATRWQASLAGDGSLRVEPVQPSPVGKLVDQLHRTAGIPGQVAGESIGVYVMGVAAVLYFLAIASGVILLLPTLVKDFFALRNGHNRKRFWLDAHNVIGITSLPFHIVISLTVIVFAFHDQFYDALGEVVYGKQPMFTPPAAAAKPYQPAHLMPLSTLVARVQTMAPGFELSELRFMNLASKRPIMRAALISPRHVVHGPESAYLMLNPYNGAVVNDSMLPGRENGWIAPVNTFFALHFGSYGGEAVRWVYFALGLSGAFLFYSGNLLWIESRRKRARRGASDGVEQARSVRWMAAATVGNATGCIAGVALALVIGQWVKAAGHAPAGVYMPVYYASYLSALLLAIAWGAARAAVPLLLLCAMAWLAIPVTSMVLASPTSLAVSMVDAVALVGAILMCCAARWTHRRCHGAPADTVWQRR